MITLKKATLLVGTIILLTILLSIFLNARSQNVTTPTPKWSNVQYSVSQAQDGWKKFESNELGYEIIYPEGTIINKGGAFSLENPEREFVSFSFAIPSKNNNLAISINTGENIYDSPNELATIDSKENRQLQEVSLSNQKAYTYYEKNPGSWEGNVYYILGGEFYYKITVADYLGQMTTQDKVTIDKMLSSFKIF